MNKSNQNNFTLEDFDFHLPEELIADTPIEPRDASRLLHIGANNTSDMMFSDIVDLLEDGDIMVFNDTKVIPARLHGKRGDANIEIMLHQKTASNIWNIFAKPAKKLKLDNIVNFDNDLSAKVIAKGEGGEVTLEFNKSGEELIQLIYQNGQVPIPPYIASKREVNEQDSTNYQTIFAKYSGAVAAPTAGLHYTQAILNRLKAKNILSTNITLHVGAGTFLPVKTENIAEHKMHYEEYVISPENARIINQAKQNGGRIIAVGTTVMRALESACGDDGLLQANSGKTNIFITPGYQFKIIDILQTNFHTPKSTLLMLVSAFCGMQRIKAAYTHAIANKYRFYSYGDTCLLEKIAG